MVQIISGINRSLKELFRAAASGWQSGRGNKLFRQRKYTKALDRYLCALGNTDNKGSEAILRQNIAATYEQLGKYDEALKNARISSDLYEQTEIDSPQINEAKTRLIEMIRRIERPWT